MGFVYHTIAEQHRLKIFQTWESYLFRNVRQNITEVLKWAVLFVSNDQTPKINKTHTQSIDITHIHIILQRTSH